MRVQIYDFRVQIWLVQVVITLHSQLSTLNPQLSTLNSHLSTLNSQHPPHRLLIPVYLIPVQLHHPVSALAAIAQ